jgi:murein L,D-transpeptidase YafK
MTPANMTSHASSRWIDFWNDLKPAYDLFEKGRQIPAVDLVDRRYVVKG